MILEGPVRQLRSQKQKDEAMKQRGRGAGCRLQSNFNEYQGEYPIFFLGISFWCIALNHCHTNKVFSIIPLVGLGNCVIPVAQASYQHTCSATLIEQMICQFVMFIFRGVLASMPCSAQPPQNTVQMLAELFFLTDLVVITE